MSLERDSRDDKLSRFYVDDVPELACVASVSVRFRSKERLRNGILSFDRARNETRAKK